MGHLYNTESVISNDAAIMGPLTELTKGYALTQKSRKKCFADPAKPCVLHVDTSFKELGAVFYQQQEDGLRPVAFGSRKLSHTENQYRIHQQEFLSLKRAVVDRFHDYLYGARFSVRTDNNPPLDSQAQRSGAQMACCCGV